jgi:hypothetical protein
MYNKYRKRKGEFEMDKKYMCLFNKNDEQLRKELQRRGIHLPSWEYSTQRAIAEIIYKDGYDCGKNPSSNNRPPLPPKPEIEIHDYLLINNCHDEKYRVSLTTEQKAFWDWLNNHGFIYSDTYIEKWLEGVIEVGCIK